MSRKPASGRPARAAGLGLPVCANTAALPTGIRQQCQALAQRRGLRRFVEAAALECVARDADGREHFLAPRAAAAWHTMVTAAAAAGIALHVLSAFRSVARQEQIVVAKLARGLPLDEVLAICAAPGYSEHHSGCAVDIGTPGAPALELAFKDTPAFAWLREHAAAFGFQLSYPAGNPQGYSFEPWHWCYHDAPDQNCSQTAP